MAGTKILVLGGTGPAGICVIRELIYRKHELIVYARTPSKIPSDLASNPLLEVNFPHTQSLTTHPLPSHPIPNLASWPELLTILHYRTVPIPIQHN